MDTQVLPATPLPDDATTVLPVTADVYDENIADDETIGNDENNEVLTEHEIHVQQNLDLAMVIIKSVIAVVIAIFVFHGVWQGNPFVAFGLYIIPMTVIVSKVFKASKTYGAMTLLMGLSLFTFLWAHTGTGLFFVFFFGAVTVGIYMFHKYLDLREERQHTTMVTDYARTL